MNRRDAVALMASLGVLAGVASPGAAGAQTNQPLQDETAAVRAPILAYFQGHATQDPAHFRKAFLPTARIEGIRQGRFVSWTLEEYSALFRGTPAADERLRTRKIDSVSVTGDAAMVKATLDHVSTVFTDYFVLLKVEGEWKIANKVYSGMSRE